MRYVLLFAALALGCAFEPAATPPALESVGSGDPAASVPEAAPDEPVPSAPSATDPGPQGCAYTAAIEPVAPPEPLEACLAERVLADGRVIQRMERRVTSDGELTTRTEETFDEAGTLAVRTMERRRGDDVVFQSTEHLLLPPDGTLPDTYGEPATWSVTTERDAAGRPVREATDLAMDGAVDGEERWTYGAAGGVIEHLRLNGGQVVMTERFREDGQPLSSLDSGGSGRVWTYDGAGLLVREDTLSQGQVMRSIAWVMQGVGAPLASATRQVWTGPDGQEESELIGEDAWTYDEAGRLQANDGWGRVYGFDRHHHTEWDVDGNEVLYIEDTEDADCHRYERRTTLSADGAVALDRLTTCDGAPFEHVWSEVDAAGRVVRTDRLFVGNPTLPIHEVDLWAYDACGARIFREHDYNGGVSQREALTLDALGRVVARVVQYPSQEHTATYAYDAAGRVTEMDGQRWTYDAAGRLVTHVLLASAGTLPDGTPAGAELRYSYDCGW